MPHLIRLIRVLLLIVSTMAGLPAARTGAQDATPAKTPSVASGHFADTIDIGGRSLFLSCEGAGSPTVILEAGGLGTPSQDWLGSGVVYGVSRFTHVCRYDRANNQSGASDPAPKPRTAEDAVADLHALLTAAAIPGPYVLVGSSFGGLLVRLYASTYPNEAVGMVLIDSVHEDQDEAAKPLFSAEVMRAVRALDAEGDGGGDPEGIYTMYGIDESFAQMRAARYERPMPDMPLIVLAAGRIDDLAEDGYPAEYATYWSETLAAQLQADLASLVPNARLLVVADSGHFIHRDQPRVVIQAIEDVVAAVRDPSAWAISATPEAVTPAP
jgi:pimeloyl-ACP methyl ester carboxylesterase